ncbi:SRPBCC domain-containing protein [Euzebya sp.]|uniref:SRPBCC family protein n=1 Tax=Euzebya sp. TaxID=1971409 RepID=UPI003517C3FE
MQHLADDQVGHVVGTSWLGVPAEPGAGDRVRLRAPVGTDRPRDARVVAVEADRRLALEWWPAGRPDDRSEVEITLRAEGTVTAVEVVERAPFHLSLV